MLELLVHVFFEYLTFDLCRSLVFHAIANMIFTIEKRVLMRFRLGVRASQTPRGGAVIPRPVAVSIHPPQFGTELACGTDCTPQASDSHAPAWRAQVHV